MWALVGIYLIVFKVENIAELHGNNLSVFQNKFVIRISMNEFLKNLGFSISNYNRTYSKNEGKTHSACVKTTPELVGGLVIILYAVYQ